MAEGEEWAVTHDHLISLIIQIHWATEGVHQAVADRWACSGFRVINTTGLFYSGLLCSVVAITSGALVVVTQLSGQVRHSEVTTWRIRHRHDFSISHILYYTTTELSSVGKIMMTRCWRCHTCPLLLLLLLLLISSSQITDPSFTSTTLGLIIISAQFFSLYFWACVLGTAGKKVKSCANYHQLEELYM